MKFLENIFNKISSQSTALKSLKVTTVFSKCLMSIILLLVGMSAMKMSLLVRLIIIH